MLATISDQPDIEIVGEIQEEHEILPVVERTNPDFLIIALEESDERPSICDLLLERFPRVKVLALAPERDSSFFYWTSFNIHSDRIEVSEQGILNALRSRMQLAGSAPWAPQK